MFLWVVDPVWQALQSHKIKTFRKKFPFFQNLIAFQKSQHTKISLQLILDVIILVVYDLILVPYDFILVVNDLLLLVLYDPILLVHDLIIVVKVFSLIVILKELILVVDLRGRESRGGTCPLGWKLLSCSQVKSWVRELTWLLIGPLSSGSQSVARLTF